MRLRTLLALGIVLLWATRGKAGPSFNSNRAELASLSRDAGAALHKGLANVHLMEQSLEEENPSQAEERRAEALKSLDLAISKLEQITAKAPAQNLVLNPNTDEEKAAVGALAPAALKRRGIESPPRTEKDLAQLATKLVSGFRAAVADSQRFDKTSTRVDRANTKAYAYFQRLFREEAFLLNVGVSVSLIWAMQEK